jgi:hypothetical protein
MFYYQHRISATLRKIKNRQQFDNVFIDRFVDNLLSIALRSSVRDSLVVGLVFGSPSRIIGKEMKASSNERFLKKLCLY